MFSPVVWVTRAREEVPLNGPLMPAVQNRSDGTRGPLRPLTAERSRSRQTHPCTAERRAQDGVEPAHRRKDPPR